MSRVIRTIVLVEDDLRQAAEVRAALERHFAQVEVIVIGAEEEFLSRLSAFQVNPPDLFIFDGILPWSVGGSKHAKPRRKLKGIAGIRCAAAVLARRGTADVQIIIQSVIEQSVLRREFKNAPENVHFRCKTSSEKDLITTIRSLLGIGHQHDRSGGSADVFLVHGHDDEAKETVARFVEKLGGRAIVLHEQPNAGRTIIEKFEHHANVAFAIVLLTPDDVGGKDSKSLKQRARQNVVFELGFFLAKLGRNKVCALHKEAVEIPSDIQGVIYTPIDNEGAWRIALARELKAAGIPLDYEKVI